MLLNLMAFHFLFKKMFMFDVAEKLIFDHSSMTIMFAFEVLIDRNFPNFFI